MALTNQIQSLRENGLIGDPIVRIVFAGDSGVGKTAIFMSYADSMIVSDHYPTIGVDFRFTRIFTEGGQPVKLQLWDTAGQERYRSITSSYYRNTDVVLLVYDITNRKSFTSLGDWVDMVTTYSGKQPHFAVVGNKLDLCGKRREVMCEEGEALAARLDAVFTEVSATSSEAQLDYLFEAVTQRAITDRLRGTQATSTITLHVKATATATRHNVTDRFTSIFSGYC